MYSRACRVDARSKKRSHNWEESWLRDIAHFTNGYCAVYRILCVLYKFWYNALRCAVHNKPEPWTHAVKTDAPPTFASFAVTRVTNLASTAIRSASILTHCIDITNGGRSSALVNVWVNNNKNDKHNIQTCATCSCWQKVWNSKYNIA